jgi:XTP/dITP diphosphohydrolase
VKLYCATTNPGKLREFVLAAERSGHDIVIEPVPDLRNIPPCEETGATFEANAVRKAIYYSQFVDGFVSADDSGLEVDALDGAPGVRSARYAGEAATDADNNRLLLQNMRGMENRMARFVCVVALARHGELIRTFRGSVDGLLLDAPRGEGGFGYDPLFFYPPYAKTLAEATPEEKLRVSHRGQALRQLFTYLRQLSKGGN